MDGYINSTDKRLYAGGKTSNDGYLRLIVYNALISSKHGFTVNQVVALVYDVTGDAIRPRTAGIILNDCRKYILRGTNYKCKVFERKKGKTYEIVYQVIKRREDTATVKNL